MFTTGFGTFFSRLEKSNQIGLPGLNAQVKHSSTGPPRLRGVARQSIVFLALAMTANALSYVYQLAMARLMEPSEYPVVLAIVSFIAIILFPANSFQAAVAVGTGHVIERGGGGQAWPFAVRAALTGGLVAVVVAAGFGIFSGPLKHVFGIEQNTILIWLAITFLLSLVLSAFRGAFQGAHRFDSLGMIMLVEAASRVMLAIVFVVIGFGVSGATAGFAFGYLVSTLLAIWLLFPKTGDRRAQQNAVSESLWPMLRIQMRSVPATFAIFGVQAIDVVIANYRLTGQEMESFSAAALAGRVIFYAGFVLGLLILPRFRDMFTSQRLRWPLIRNSVSVMVVIAIPTIATGYLVPDLLHNMLVGDRYAADADLLQVYLLGTALLTTSLFLTYILIAAGWTWIWVGLVPVAIVQTGAYLYWAASTMDFARVLLGSGACMAIFLIVATVVLFRKIHLNQARVYERDIDADELDSPPLSGLQ